MLSKTSTNSPIETPSFFPLFYCNKKQVSHMYSQSSSSFTFLNFVVNKFSSYNFLGMILIGLFEETLVKRETTPSNNDITTSSIT